MTSKFTAFMLEVDHEISILTGDELVSSDLSDFPYADRFADGVDARTTAIAALDHDGWEGASDYAATST